MILLEVAISHRPFLVVVGGHWLLPAVADFLYEPNVEYIFQGKTFSHDLLFCFFFFCF
jgi:hypothetical protein